MTIEGMRLMPDSASSVPADHSPIRPAAVPQPPPGAGATGLGRPPDLGIIPALEAARSALASYRSDYDRRDRDVVRVPDEVSAELIRGVARVSRRVRQIIPLALPHTPAGRAAPSQPRFWSLGPDAAAMVGFAQAVSRSLVALNRTVERIYLVPPGGAHADEVSSQVADDEHYKIASISIRVNELRQELAQHTPVSHIWIVDDDAVMYQEATDDGPSNWMVSARQEDIERANELWDALKAQSASGGQDDEDGRFDLTDPLLISAERLAITAPMSCTEGNGTWERCDWYHGSWQYLRLFNMVSSPRWHDEFYRTRLREVIDHVYSGRASSPDTAAPPSPRILITGSADYSMLAYVIDALRRSSVPSVRRAEPPAVHVLDLCPTPLMACRWYSRLVDYPVETHEADICGNWSEKWAPSGSFDLVTTDAFLTRFSREDCETVIGTWWDLLAAGGRVVTTVRLHERGDYLSDDVEQVAAYVMRVRRAARRWRPLLRAGVDAICGSAREYAHRISSTDLGSASDIIGLFEGAGFEVLPETRESELLPGELQQTRYLRIVAAKPEGSTASAARVTTRGTGRAEEKGATHAFART